MSGGGVDRAIRRLRRGPDDGLVAGEDGVDLGREGEASFAGERDAGELAFDEVGVGGHLPGGGDGCREREDTEGCEAQDFAAEARRRGGTHYSFTSTCTVLFPVTTMSPASTSKSASFELRVCVIAPLTVCWPASSSATDAGGSGRSAPSSWKAGLVRQTRT